MSAVLPAQPSLTDPHRPAVPPAVTAAAVMLVVLGSLSALGGVVGMPFAVYALGSAGVAVGFAAVAFGAAEIASGIRMATLRNSWRILGMGLAGTGGVLSLLVAAAHQIEMSLSPDETLARVAYLVVEVLAVAAHAFVIAALALAGRFFER